MLFDTRQYPSKNLYPFAAGQITTEYNLVINQPVGLNVC